MKVLAEDFRSAEWSARVVAPLAGVLSELPDLGL